MWILELLKNQSEYWKSPGYLCLKKDMNPVFHHCVIIYGWCMTLIIVVTLQSLCWILLCVVLHTQKVFFFLLCIGKHNNRGTRILHVNVCRFTLKKNGLIWVSTSAIQVSLYCTLRHMYAFRTYSFDSLVGSFDRLLTSLDGPVRLFLKNLEKTGSS